MFIGNSNEKSVGALDNSHGISSVLDFLKFFFSLLSYLFYVS